MSNNDKLKQLYKQANSFDESTPKGLMDKLSTYGKILELLGGFHASSLADWKHKESIRRETIANAFSLDPQGTVEERKQKAEMAAAEARRNEAQAEGEAMRWKNAYDSVKEQIQILKLQLKDIKDVNNGGI